MNLKQVNKSLKELELVADKYGGVVEYCPPLMPYVFFPDLNCGFMADPQTSSPEDLLFSGFTFFGPESLKAKFQNLQESLSLSSDPLNLLTPEMVPALVGKVITCSVEGKPSKRITFIIGGMKYRRSVSQAQDLEQVLLIRYCDPAGHPLRVYNPARIYFKHGRPCYPSQFSFLINGKDYELSKSYTLEQIKSIFKTKNACQVLQLDPGQHGPYFIEVNKEYEEAFADSGGVFRAGSQNARLILEEIR